VKQSNDDKLYNVDGLDIIVTGDSEFELKGAKIDFGGMIFKDFIVTPKFS
jgi:Fe-S cluster assembly iron-binding protein IscA